MVTNNSNYKEKTVLLFKNHFSKLESILFVHILLYDFIIIRIMLVTNTYIMVFGYTVGSSIGLHEC
jgi:hypothetical protein